MRLFEVSTAAGSAGPLKKKQRRGRRKKGDAPTDPPATSAALSPANVYDFKDNGEHEGEGGGERQDKATGDGESASEQRQATGKQPTLAREVEPVGAPQEELRGETELRIGEVEEEKAMVVVRKPLALNPSGSFQNKCVVDRELVMATVNSLTKYRSTRSASSDPAVYFKGLADLTSTLDRFYSGRIEYAQFARCYVTAVHLCELGPELHSVPNNGGIVVDLNQRQQSSVDTWTWFIARNLDRDVWVFLHEGLDVGVRKLKWLVTTIESQGKHRSWATVGTHTITAANKDLFHSPHARVNIVQSWMEGVRGTLISIPTALRIHQLMSIDANLKSGAADKLLLECMENEFQPTRPGQIIVLHLPFIAACIASN